MIDLDGTANKDLWMFDGHMVRVAVGPIRSKAGQVVGALLVGYVSSAQDAAADRKKLGVHVAYFLDDGDLKTALAWVRRVARWRS